MESAGRLGTANGLTRACASLSLALILSACAVATPAAITSAQSAPSAVQSLEFVSQEEEERGIRARFKSALGSAFADQGVNVAQGSSYLADFTVSQRPAELGLQDVSGDVAGDVAGDDAEAGAPKSDFKPRWYHACKPQRVSASLVIYAKASGTLHSKAQGQFLSCPGDTAQLDDLAQLLAARTLRN